MNVAQLYFGIYLGADKCAIASHDGVESKICKNNEGFEATPSAVWMDSKERLHVGRRAKDQLENDPENAFSEFMFQMGTDTQYTFDRNKKKMSPQELSAEVLKALKEDVRRQLGEEVTSVVITVPAAFELPQCKATNEAAELAEFVNHALLQEPIAAAMAYGFQSETSNKFWMVYNFGGGTFDASIIQIKDGQIEVVNQGGDNGLSGKNLDWEIVNSLLAPAAAKQNNLKNFNRGNKQFRGAFAKLKAEAEKAKIRLSLEDSVEIYIDTLFKNDKGEAVEFTYELLRSDFEKLAKPYIIQSINICKKVLMEKRLGTSNIEKMIMIGGTSLIPILREMLLNPNEGLGIPLESSIDPLTVVVRGAAIFASTQFLSYNLTEDQKNNKNSIMDTIEQKVIDEIELWSDRDEIKLTDDLLSVLSEDCDIELIATMIEVEFDLETLSLDEEMHKVKTVSDLVKLVKSKLDGKDYFEAIPQKNDVAIIQPTKTEEKKTEKKSFPTNESYNPPKLDCEILMQAAAPDIYRINAFRISGLNVNATTREISTQVQKNQMMEKYGGKTDNHKSPFPIEPAPDVDKLRQALHRLRDPETRIMDEFFWFWPHSLDTAIKDHALEALSKNDTKAAESLWINYEATLTESNVSRHNLAVLSHLLVLDIELNGKDLTTNETALKDKLWKDTFKRWKLLLEHEGFWSRLTARVRQMDDPRLTTGFVNRLRAALPYAILQINGMMAVEFAEKGKDEEAKRHLELIQSSGFESDVIDRALRTAIDPVRKKIKVFCLSACDESEKNNIRGIELGRQVLTQTQNPLNILKILLPKKHVIIEGAEDDIIDHVFKCYTKYVNKTEDYVSALELIKSIKKLIKNDAQKAKVDEKIKSIEGILEYSNFWRLTGYFSYPSKCVEMMEKAYDLQDTLKYDEAIDLLRKGLYSLHEIQDSDLLRKQFLHCIAYCFRRKSVRIFNEAFDENEHQFNKIYNNLVKYRTFVSEYSSITFCAHCYGSIYGTYYTRTINGVKQPFCNSCNNKIDGNFKELEDELKKEIKKAFDLILLSKFLSPNHNPTKIDFEAIKESADKRNIRSTETSDLLLKFNLLDISETINLLTSPSGKKDSKLYSHLVSILESKDTKGRIKTFILLFNNHSALIKELLPYFFNNKTIFNDFVKFVFDAQYNLSADKKQDVLNDLLQMDNYNICFRLLSIFGGSNNQQNIIDRIVKRLIEFIHEKITNISFDDISFKYGELGDIILSASQISEDLKNKCILAIISVASKDKNKALKIISVIYEDKQAEQLFFQILYSNDQLFDKQTRIQYYEYLLGHWDATIRKKAIEWLNANITDNQAKIKYFIKSLSDPDNSIQEFVKNQIEKYPEEAAELLLEASYTNNSTQIVNIRSLLKTILSNLNWNSPKAISLKSLINICHTHKDKEISQLILNIIEKNFPDWTSSPDVKSCLKNIKYTANIGQGHNSQIANEMLAKMKAASFGNRLLITFSGSEQSDNPTAPDWCELVIIGKEDTSEIGSFISSENAEEELFNKLKKYRLKLKPVKINGFSKICYEHHISPDGSVLLLTVFREKGFAYDSDKEKSSLWDLYSLDLKSGTLRRLFYIHNLWFRNIVMIGNSCYAEAYKPEEKIVCWNWSDANDFNYLKYPYDEYHKPYPQKLNRDLLIEQYQDGKDEFFSLNNNLKKIDFVLAKNETLGNTHKSKNYILISKRPLKSDGYTDYDAPESYLLVSLNDSLSKSSRKEVFKESFKYEISSLDFYGDNHIIYKKKTSKDSDKYDIYIQDMDDNKKYQKVISNVDCEFLQSKSGYILYTNYFDSTKSTDLIIHKVSSGESVKLLNFNGEGYRDFQISDDWSTFSYLKQTESGDEEEIPCNIYLVNLDMNKNFKEEISIKAEDNSYVKIKDSK